MFCAVVVILRVDWLRCSLLSCLIHVCFFSPQLTKFSTMMSLQAELYKPMIPLLFLHFTTVHNVKFLILTVTKADLLVHPTLYQMKNIFYCF